ncbi:1,6-anhydro-N-acetylmuramyl-L-alanine amidase AmpD [Nevskia ramosa]|uniref:1,6-anhydro-N-acetylmuramyl-L-alanine amidase AmpD n=1 Tax=Nevskia ramosa TaxID=64002 RepID=UPI0003B35EE4|nr:1,6-anhydro-N-acetylmuramyl-L-alanine amidase AmpD [Nevskia ramosa]
MAADAIAQRLPGALWCASPNSDERPDPADLALIVIHNISLPPDSYDAHPDAPEGSPPKSYIDDLFLNRLDPAAHPYFASIAGLQVSAHLCIFRDGRIHQYAAFDRRAWHAGASTWQGRSRCNDFSIGIELEGSDTRPFTDAQYTALIDTIRWLQTRYPQLPREAITGHSDIAPGRKTDPGPHFDWPRLRTALGIATP